MTHDVHIIGGGLAGSEAAWQLARRGFRVRLSEMRGGGDTTPAHQTDGLAELVCSNSFRSDDDEKNAVGLLHHEMRRLDSLVMRAGEVARVPAGSAMAVDRDVFSAEVERALSEHPNVTVVRASPVNRAAASRGARGRPRSSRHRRNGSCWSRRVRPGRRSGARASCRRRRAFRTGARGNRGVPAARRLRFRRGRRR